MLSLLALIFLVPSGLAMWIPTLTAIAGHSTGDQGAIAIIGFAIGIPGLILVAIDLIRRRRRALVPAFLGVFCMFSNLFVGLPLAVFCEYTAMCGALGKNRLHWRVEPSSLPGISWRSEPNATGFEGATIIGSQHSSGPYLRRFKLKQGGIAGPLHHSDDRVFSVTTGTLNVATGPYPDSKETVSAKAGEAFIVQKGYVYSLSAPDGDVVFEVSGTGPSEDFIFELQ